MYVYIYEVTKEFHYPNEIAMSDKMLLKNELHRKNSIFQNFFGR